MKCPRCQYETSLGNKFCSECGNLLAHSLSRTQQAPSYADLQHSLTEALEQQTATSEILRVISQSPADVQPVMQTIVDSAVRIADAYDALIGRAEGNHIRWLAVAGTLSPALPHVSGQPITRSLPSGRAIIDRQTTQVEDISVYGDEFPGVAAAYRELGVRTILATPLLREGNSIGVMLVRRTEVRPFTEQQITLLQTFADQAVIAIENVRLFNETKEALERQTATAEILRIITNSPTDVQPVLEAAVQNAARLCGTSNVSLYQVEGSRMRKVAEHGLPLTGLSVGNTRPLSRTTVSGRAILDGTTIHLADHQGADALREYPDARRDTGIRTTIGVPLLREGVAIGAFTAYRTESRPFAEREIALLKTFADQAAIAIENVRLFKELQTRNSELTEALEQQTATSEILSAISSSPTELQPVLDAVAENAARVCGASDAIIRRVEGELLVPAAHFGSIPMSTALVVRPITRGSAIGRAALERRTIHLYDLPNPDFVREYPEGVAVQQSEGFRTIVTTPLLREGTAIGIIAIRRLDPHPFTDKQIALLQTFADQAVIAIENVRLFNELEAANRELAAASQHKSEFLANMSHELRTPLNAIIGFSEVLTDRMFGEVNEKQEEYLKDINASGGHLLSLINDILDLSKIEAGRMELELTEFHLPTAIENALMLVRERAGRRSLTLQTDIDDRLGQIKADERKIRQVVLNLLSNAIKFTAEGGRIEVAAAPRDGFAEVSVNDTGIGIAPEDQERVFEEFRQVGTAAKKIEGTGLGLTLCRKFVELHGGRIWVKSQVGEGSTFTFNIPARHI